MEQQTRGTLASYTTGFFFAIVLTLLPYLLVQRHLHQHLLTYDWLVAAIVALALMQLIVQLVFFLHLDKGSDRRWNIAVLLFAVMIVAIVVFGSLWIMNNLNDRMSPSQMIQYMNSQDGI